MTFKDAMAHYRAGTASEEERALVEEELEKNRLIAEYLDEAWDDSTIAEDVPVQEMKAVRNHLRRRNVIIVLTSLVLTAALLLGVVYVGIPAAESLYWDPNTRELGLEHSTDLEMTIAAYAELLCPDLNIATVHATHTGFASYDISIQYWNSHKGGDSLFSSARLEKDELTFATGFIRMESINIFERASYPVYSLDAMAKTGIYSKLSDLPDYVTITAAVSFAEDKSMEDLVDLQNRLENAYIGWTGIRNSPENEQLLPLCGMDPYGSGTYRKGYDDRYPCLDSKSMVATAQNLEEHFTSLLRYSADQVAKGEGIPEYGHSGDCYYTEVLDYVEENGIYSYGCYITGSPKAILALLDSGEITQAWVEDAWINF